jgi:hypothetical protein
MNKTGTKKTRIIVTIVILAVILCALVFFLRQRKVVNGKILTGITSSSDSQIADKYLSQEYKASHTFADKKLNDQFVKTSAEVTGRESGLLGPENITVKVTNTVDTDALKTYLDQWNSENTASKDASIYYDDASGKYQIEKESQGTRVDTDALIRDAEAGKTGLKLSDYYVKPVYTAKNLKEKAEKLNKLLDWHVTYSDGKKATISKNDITVQPDGSYQLADLTKTFKQLLTEVNKDYTTVGKGFPVLLHDGSMQTVTGGTWGTYVDTKSEISHLMEDLDEAKSEDNREPEMAGKANDMSKYDSDLIIEVSISQQHLWAYDPSGNIKIDYPVVTGQKGVTDTPTGVFYCLMKKKDHTMNGTSASGKAYSTDCSRFMWVTNSGVGIHDAPWRNAFGGTIYMTHGSNGCINSPTDKATELYDMVKEGKTMIIIHQ